MVLKAQQNTYIVNKTTFSSGRYDEFSPVYYNNGIVFISDSHQNLFLDVKTTENKNPFKILFVEKTGDDNWRDPSIFSKDLLSGFNDGPVSFSSTGDLVYYSSNINFSGTGKKNKRKKNRLGIFYSEYDGSGWGNIKAFRFNDDYYSVTMPALSSDGSRLYFVSDKPGGIGGSDIYYCERRDGYWGDPVNMGPVINTPGNESYPFVNSAGELFFSSDGHGGLGGKDIFFTAFDGTTWLPPVQLDTPINSPYDDFGIVFKDDMGSGYFSSNRDRASIDIYSITTVYPQHFYSTEQKDNITCFRFLDDGSITFDESVVGISWDFGDGETVTGGDVLHCFPVSGQYVVKESFIDRKRNKPVMIKNEGLIDIADIEQPYISGDRTIVVGSTSSFSAQNSNMPKYEILEYFWDMGDGARYKGSTVSHFYSKVGDYKVKLGVIARSNEDGDVVHPSVYINLKVVSGMSVDSVNINDMGTTYIQSVEDNGLASLETIYSATDIISKPAVYDLVLLSSKEKLGVDNKIFDDLRQKYYIREEYEEDGSYNYVAVEEKTFENAFLSYQDIIGNNHFSPTIVIRTISDPAEREFYNLKSVYSNDASQYFQNKETRFVPRGLIFFNQIVALMRKYPNTKLLIECHTDEMSTAALDITLSRRRAEALMDYIVGKEVNSSRLVVRGYGNTRPAYANDIQERVILSNRVDIYLLSD